MSTLMTSAALLVQSDSVEQVEFPWIIARYNGGVGTYRERSVATGVVYHGRVESKPERTDGGC